MKNIGKILILLMTLNSSNCKKTESSVYTSEFEIINSTDTGLTITSWLDYRQKKSIYIEKGNSFYSKEVGESPITAAEFWDSDSLEIKFADNKILIYSWNRVSPTSKNILIDGWSVNKIADRQTKRIYKIEQEHRDSAK